VLTKSNHDFMPFSGKPQKSETGMPEREVLLLFTFPNMSTAELFDKKIVSEYSSNGLIKKEPKFDDRLSKFDWHVLPPILLAIMLKIMLLHVL
jgi:hypothetical protein